MPRRYQYNHMTADQLAAGLEETGIHLDDLVYLSGISERKAVLMLHGDEQGGEIPHFIAVMLSLMTLPGAVDQAFATTDSVQQGIIRGRQMYARLKPWDMHRRMQNIGINKRQLIKITGLNEQKVDRMIIGETDVPHAVRVILDLLTLPGALDLALAVTHAMLIKEEVG